MRKTIVLLMIASLAFSIVAKANPVDVRTAQNVGTRFLAANTRVSLRGTNDLQLVATYTVERGNAAFYVFNAPGGFVIVSADDCAYPILGYSDEGRQFDPNNIPIQLQDVLQEYVGQIQYAIENNIQADEQTARQWRLVETTGRLGNNRDNTQVGPLLTTTWGQGQYYNAMCPEDVAGPGGHVYTGCVATAMAQIIKYHDYPQHGRGTHSYQSNYGELSINYEESDYDYDNMPDALSSASGFEEIDAVAKLMYDCGVAVNMSYNAVESGAYDMEARAALINFFKFSPDMSFAERAFFTADEWDAMIRVDLDLSHPVYYSGNGSIGHAFVCDGYNPEGYYHFNFGWNGAGDSWYLLTAVNFQGMNFNSNQAAIFGIASDANGNVILGQSRGTSTFMVDEPLEFYHIMGHNAYEGNNYSNLCDNTVTFISANPANQMVVDILEFEDQNLTINDSNGTQLRGLSGGVNNDLSPVVSTTNAMDIVYSGNMFYAGFKIIVSQDDGCRMVSGITSFMEDTTVHFTWTENGGATQWQIEYGIKGFGLGSGVVCNVTTNTVMIENLERFTEYDFYIRSVCGDDQFGFWNKVTLMVEAPYWQDVVDSQPEGYVYNDVTRSVEIYTAEGLAWWAKTGCSFDAYLNADIDLSGYKWQPVGSYCSLYGQGHIISNAYINEHTDDVGLFSDFHNGGIVSELGLVNFNVKGLGNRTGGLCGTLRGTIKNCYIKNSVIEGDDFTGGLVGTNSNGTILNSFVNVFTIGARWAGLMVGSSNDGIEKNCYASGSFRQRAYCYNGGIVAFSSSGEISHCYSIEMPMGVVGNVGNTIVADTSTFVKTGLTCTLLNPVTFDDESVSDLLTALNCFVEQTNDDTYCVWTQDLQIFNDGYPVLGDKYVVQCPNVSDVSIQNVKIGDSFAISVGWTENGGASQWRIRYRRHDIPNAPYTYITTTNNPTIIQGIPLGYVYDFNVRAVCDSEHNSGWSETCYSIIDKIYWTDVVTTQPAGYTTDANGNVEISTAEGLAWLSVLVSGLHEQQPNSFEGKTITLVSDINLDGYRWYPIGRSFRADSYPFKGIFEGHGHIISNIYVNDAGSSIGLFGNVMYGSIRNVDMSNGMVASIFTQTELESSAFPSSAIGGLVGRAYGCNEISNCHSSTEVYGSASVGSLCGDVTNQTSSTITKVSNCSATGGVSGRQSCGGLIGNVYGTVAIDNCFSIGDVNITTGSVNAWYRGGLIGNFMSGASVNNCYSIGTVYVDSYNYVAKVVGCPYWDTHIHYIYGRDDVNPEMELVGGFCEDIANTSQFHHDGNLNSLLFPITVVGEEYSDLLDALNAWVVSQNDRNLKTWILDNNTGYPILGGFFEPSCYNPTDLIVSNATVVGDPTIRTKLTWTQIENPDHWEVLYVAAGHEITEGVIVPVTSNPCVLTDIPVGQPLDFYVRSVCSENDMSNWSHSVRYIPDKLRWTEVVTSQPDGYLEDVDGNVYISSAEGLAWLSSVANGLNGEQYDEGHFGYKRIELVSDIDLSAYRWTPIGTDRFRIFIGAIVNGNNHTIHGLYCNELEDRQAMFGYFINGSVSNLFLEQCDIRGKSFVGPIVGYALGVQIKNCAVEGVVYGIEYVGGIVGKGDCSIVNSCFIGNVSSRDDVAMYGGYVGGICGVSDESTIENCYVVCEITDDLCSGIITGSGSGSVSHCYYKAYQTDLEITNGNFVTLNNSSFSGGGYTWTLNTPPYISGEFRTDLVDALNAWVDANNESGQYLHWVADTENVNGGFPMLEQAAATQTLSLARGTNWVSFYVDIDLTDLQDALASAFSGTNVLLQGQDSYSTFNGTRWRGTLNALDLVQMYMIDVAADREVTLVGRRINQSEHPITINMGSNWLGYPLMENMSLDEAFAGFAVFGDLILSRNGYATYNGTRWRGGLTTLEPGQGYIYESNTSETRTFTFPVITK